jgi:acyl-CoA reductase-like NAD-dependent aldehyde dehydrogenase
MRFASNIEFGIYHMDRTDRNDEPQMSFGGVKGSGYSRSSLHSDERMEGSRVCGSQGTEPFWRVV